MQACDSALLLHLTASTEVQPQGPADKAGLRVGDKILQCNEYDFTIVTHKKACDYLRKGSIANLLVARRGVTQQ